MEDRINKKEILKQIESLMEENGITLDDLEDYLCGEIPTY